MNRVVSFVFAALLGFTPAAARGECAIEGAVVDSANAQPLPKTQIFAAAYAEDDSGIPVRRIAGANGEFCFEHLDPGKYILTAHQPGYLDARYGAQRPDSPGLILEISPDKRQLNLILKMSAAAAISGSVVDADGDPIANAAVELAKRGWSEGKIAADGVTQTQTDDQGIFRLGDLAAGTYFVSARSEEENYGQIRQRLDDKGQPFRERDAKTYYEGSLSFQGATPIVLKTGQELTGVNIAIQKTQLRHLSGRIGPGWNGSVPRILILGNEDSFAASLVQIQKDGIFRADGLLPGQYLLKTWAGGTIDTNASVDLTEHDADGLVLEPVEMVNLEMIVQIDRPGAKPSDFDRIFLLDPKSNQGHAAIREPDGKFRFSGLAPGVYIVNVNEGSEHYFVKRVIVDGESQSGARIDLRRIHPKLLEVVVSSNMAALTGRVSADHPIATGVTVVLTEETGSPTTHEQTWTDTIGQFEWKSLAPGKYRVYAFEDLDENFWGSPDVAANLAGKSIALELHEGEKRRLTVPLISAAEYQQALRKAGF